VRWDGPIAYWSMGDGKEGYGVVNKRVSGMGIESRGESERLGL
jgi:hypothetical protein